MDRCVDHIAARRDRVTIGPGEQVLGPCRTELCRDGGATGCGDELENHHHDEPDSDARRTRGSRWYPVTSLLICGSHRSHVSRNTDSRDEDLAILWGDVRVWGDVRNHQPGMWIGSVIATGLRRSHHITWVTRNRAMARPGHELCSGVGSIVSVGTVAEWRCRCA